MPLICSKGTVKQIHNLADRRPFSQSVSTQSANKEDGRGLPQGGEPNEPGYGEH